MANRKLIVEIIGDSRSLDKAFKSAGRASETFGHKIGRALKASALALGVVAVAAGGVAVAFGIKSVKAAMSLEASIRRVNLVFGKSAPGIREWGAKAALSMGLSEDAALAAAGSIGILARNMGIGSRSAASVSKEMVKLSVDLAALNKASPEDTLKALQRGLAGQMRGLKQFGIVISMADVQAKALSMGLVQNTVDMAKVQSAQLAVTDALKKQSVETKKHGAGSAQAHKASVELAMAQDRLTKAMAGQAPKLNSLQKFWAIHALILQRSAIAQGFFARHAKTLTELFPIMHAEVKNLTEQFGLGLLPVVRKVAVTLATKLADPKFRAFVRHLGHDVGVFLLHAFTAISKWFSKHWPQILAGFRTAGKIIATMFHTLQQFVKILTPAVKTLNSLKVPGTHSKLLPIGKALLNAPIPGSPGMVGGLRHLIHRQEGGSVAAGGSYMVGERGPELFTPSTGGNITANGGGGNGDLILQIDGREIARIALSHLQRMGKQQAGQTRGRHGGQKLALG